MSVMFKYLNQIFQNAMSRSQQMVGFQDDADDLVFRIHDGILERRPVNTNLLSFSRFYPTMLEPARLDPKCPDTVPIRLGMRKSWVEKTDFEDVSDEEASAKSESSSCQAGSKCKCDNCSVVAEISECAVCLDPIQSRGVRSCSVCSNLVCGKCSLQIQKCAFCRAFVPMQRNRAVERLLEKFASPCRNSRNGCRVLLKSETRMRHELNCNFAFIKCPISGEDSCEWQGNKAGILKHVLDEHNLKPLISTGVAVEVLTAMRKFVVIPGECTIYLSCYRQLFGVKLTMHKEKIVVAPIRLGYVARVTEKIAASKYRVYVGVKVGGKSIRGTVPFGRGERENRDIEFAIDQLFSKRGDSPSGSEAVRLEIVIKTVTD